MPGHKLNPDDVDKELRQVIDERNNNQVYFNLSRIYTKIWQHLCKFIFVITMKKNRIKSMKIATIDTYLCASCES